MRPNATLARAICWFRPCAFLLRKDSSIRSLACCNVSPSLRKGSAALSYLSVLNKSLSILSVMRENDLGFGKNFLSARLLRIKNSKYCVSLLFFAHALYVALACVSPFTPLIKISLISGNGAIKSSSS